MFAMKKGNGFQERVNNVRAITEQQKLKDLRKLQKQKQEKKRQAALDKKLADKKQVDSSKWFLTSIRSEEFALIKEISRSGELREALQTLLDTSAATSNRYRLRSSEKLELSPYDTGDFDKKTISRELYINIQILEKALFSNKSYYQDWGIVISYNFDEKKLSIRITNQSKEYESLDEFLDYLATEVVKLENEKKIEPKEPRIDKLLPENTFTTRIKKAQVYAKKLLSNRKK